MFVAFDQAIQLLQVKPVAFLEKRPIISNFADHQPRFGARPKREAKDNHDLLEDWVKQIERRGHPAPKMSRLTSWGIPFATWTSPFSCHMMKTAKDCETLAYHQMDPGRYVIDGQYPNLSKTSDPLTQISAGCFTHSSADQVQT